MTQTLKIAVVACCAALVLTGCDVGASSSVLGGPSGNNNPGGNSNPGGGGIIVPEGGDTGVDPMNPTDPNGTLPDPNNPDPNNPPVNTPRCDMGKTYLGFAGTDLVGDRMDLDMGVDRARVKPFTSLSGEYSRVLGNTPALIAGLGTTFGQPVARWSDEPQSSAVSLFTAYRVAFQGCLTMTAQPTQYGTAPTAATAETECGNFARKFWSRTASPEEITMCVKATVGETTPETNARRRWAYGCATVLTSAGFLSY